MLKVELLLTFLKYFGVWVQIGSCLSAFILYITRDKEVISSLIVFVCLFGMIPTIWKSWNDTMTYTIVCRYIGGDVWVCMLCAMHSWRHWWCHHFKKLNNVTSTSADKTLSGLQDIFLSQSSSVSVRSASEVKNRNCLRELSNTCYAHGSFNLTSDMEAKW